VIGGSNRLLTPQELAEMLGVPLSTVYDKWRDWGLPGKKIGKALRFRERDVLTWLEKQNA
jgi:excisionase family DNA binding protein